MKAEGTVGAPTCFLYLYILSQLVSELFSSCLDSKLPVGMMEYDIL
jgi:hypothetical protein